MTAARLGALTCAWAMTACSTVAIAPVPDVRTAAAPERPLYQRPGEPVEARVEDLLARMTLAEKIGQMTQAERRAVDPAQAGQWLLGSVLSGGGSAPGQSEPAAWIAMIDAYQHAAAATRLAIPILYGIDAVHGHQSVAGATVFPHLLGLAATRDAGLLRRVGEVTAREMAATGIFWNFSPMVSVSEDLRWGRTFESFGEDPALVTLLGRALAEGQMAALAPQLPQVLPTAKHFIGDGGTQWGSVSAKSATPTYRIDRGDTRGDGGAMLSRYLPPYRALVEASVGSAMVTYSSWNGRKLHGERALVTDVLKGRLGFNGFVVSDWDAIQELPGSFRQQVVAAVNAGIDMAMVPFAAREFIETLTAAVTAGDVSTARIDDAVRRILRVKFRMGLFEQSRALPNLLPAFGGAAHRAVAREAVARSVTLLKNETALPLSRNATILVAGAHADDLGAQAGGWTLEWQGVQGNNDKRLSGTTLLAGLRQVAGPATHIRYDLDGRQDGRADIGIVVVGEQPYAEGVGDRDIETLTLGDTEHRLIAALRPRVRKLVLLIVAGRPLLLGNALDSADAVVMTYLPGSEGAGVADVLFGDRPFTGRLPIGWPRSAAGYTRADAPPALRCPGLQWSAGFGLDARGGSLGNNVCP